MSTKVLAEKCCETQASPFGGWRAWLRCRREQARRRRLIHHLDDRMLRDIGLSRGELLSRTLLREGERDARAGMTARPAWGAWLALTILTLTIAVTAAGS